MKEEIVELSLKRMFSGKHFNICTVRDGLEVLEIIPDKELMKQLGMLHCVDYSDMTPSIRTYLLESVVHLFNGQKLDLSSLEFNKSINIDNKSSFRKLIGV